MKIALLYSGHLRSIEQTCLKHRQFIELLSSEYDVKIFCQTWDEVESVNYSWYEKNKLDNIQDYFPEAILRKSLQPDAIRIDTTVDFKKAPVFYKSTMSYEGVASMFDGIKKSYLLYKDYAVYHKWHADVIIRIRYDVVFDIEKLKSRISAMLEKKQILVYNSTVFDFIDTFSDTLIVLPNNDSCTSFFYTLDKFLDNVFLSKYFAIYDTFIAEFFISDLILNQQPKDKVFQKLSILRINGDVVVLSDEISIEHHLRTLENVHFQFYDYFRDKAFFKKKLNHYLDIHNLKQYCNFYTPALNLKDYRLLLKQIVGKTSKELLPILNNAIAYNNYNVFHLILLKISRKIILFKQI